MSCDKAIKLELCNCASKAINKQYRAASCRLNILDSNGFTQHKERNFINIDKIGGI
jgi:hypothetical protein